MPRELFLLRNAEADPNANCDDFDKPLLLSGKRAAQTIGVWLAEKQLIPDLIISSPAKRAMATAQKCCKTMGLPVKIIWKDARIYQADTKEILSVLSDLNTSLSKILLVGHNPGIKKLVRCLANNDSKRQLNAKKLMQRATLARVSVLDKWDNILDGGGTLMEIIQASNLVDRFPFPDIDGKKTRRRPAYYYTQSGVLPYRWDGGKLEIMVISSSNNKRWVIPKGIIDPGLSPQQSAVKEAYEEAGIQGFIDYDPIGQYSYPKWGADCYVTVFPFEVTTLIQDDEWQESYRERKWVTSKKAKKLVSRPDLAHLIELLERKLRKQAA